MYPYLAFLFASAVASLGEKSTNVRRQKHHIGLAAFFQLLTIFSGFRYEVGSDWGIYLEMLHFASDRTLAETLARSEPGYMLLNYVAAQSDLGIAFVNVACSTIASVALFNFCREQTRPWLAAFLVFTTTYVLIVMGLPRQGVAVSLSTLAIHRLAGGHKFKFIILISMATLFHSSAVILFALLSVALNIGKIWRFAISLGASAAFFLLTWYYFSTELSVHYIDYGRDSGGAVFRVAIHLMAALMFLAYRNRMGMDVSSLRIYTSIALVMLFLPVALLLSPSSTLLDRLAFYTYVIHYVTISRVPNIVRRNRGFSPGILWMVIVFYGLQFLVWMLAGDTSDRFTPYQMVWFGVDS